MNHPTADLPISNQAGRGQHFNDAIKLQAIRPILIFIFLHLNFLRVDRTIIPLATFNFNFATDCDNPILGVNLSGRGHMNSASAYDPVTDERGRVWQTLDRAFELETRRGSLFNFDASCVYRSIPAQGPLDLNDRTHRSGSVVLIDDGRGSDVHGPGADDPVTDESRRAWQTADVSNKFELIARWCL